MRTKSPSPKKPGTVAIGPPHGLDHQVHRSGRPSGGTIETNWRAGPFVELEALQDIEHFHQADPAAARGRRGEDVIAAIGAVDRLAHTRLIGGQVLLGDQPAAGLHLRHDQISDRPAVESIRPVSADLLKRPRQFRLHQAITRLPSLSSARRDEHALQLGKLRRIP